MVNYYDVIVSNFYANNYGIFIPWGNGERRCVVHWQDGNFSNDYPLTAFDEDAAFKTFRYYSKYFVHRLLKDKKFALSEQLKDSNLIEDMPKILDLATKHPNIYA